MPYRLILFLILNFSALALGGLFTSQGVGSEWYFNLQKAPWTPPGWVFGTAWTTIMILFSFYMSLAWTSISNQKLLIILFILQWILNVSWNPVFFYFHQTSFGLIIISLLTLLIAFFQFGFLKELGFKSIFALPYFLWLLIATSLNAYIVFMNK